MPLRKLFLFKLWPDLLQFNPVSLKSIGIVLLQVLTRFLHASFSLPPDCHCSKDTNHPNAYHHIIPTDEFPQLLYPPIYQICTSLVELELPC